MFLLQDFMLLSTTVPVDLISSPASEELRQSEARLLPPEELRPLPT